ncbi:MAG TPA: primosomal protein N' [Dehalococcoidia bacterium]|nr:primosomal protein N' [Dehalococcoidia bacterium]
MTTTAHSMDERARNQRALFAEVAVHSTLPHRQTFSYGIPAHLAVRPGHAVYIPFGRQTLQGIVLEVHDTPVFSDPEKIRPVRSIIGEVPLIDAERLALARWIADFYVAPIFDCVALFLPPGFERRPLTLVQPLVDESEIAGLDLSARQREVLTSLFSEGGRDLDALRRRLAFVGMETALAQLEKRGLIVREYVLARPRIGARTVRVATLALAPEEALQRAQASAPAKHSRRGAVLRRLLERRSISTDEATRLAGSRANLDRLVRAGSVRYDREGHALTLGVSQAEAAEEIRVMTEPKRAAQAAVAVRELGTHGARTLAELRAAGVETATSEWLAEIGALTLTETAIERRPLEHFAVVRRPPAHLLPAQAAAAEAIHGGLRGGRGETFLLHGVTGSGKTEVYLQALNDCIAAGRRAVVMVPEIALTPQTVRRFRERFERVAVLHSGLTDGELFDQWHGVAAGQYDVVIGSRSAIFAPQPNLGLIVIDEEHEWTYKQHDAQPRYHARDVAVELARLQGAALVLGSATPDVASYARAQSGAYTLLKLPERIRPVAASDGTMRPEASAAMPQISVIDLREELRAGNRSMFSGELRAAVSRALAADEQVILFLNRRGLAGHVQCRDCGFVPECTSCAVALSFHRQYDRLVCHQCNRQWRLPTTCRQCGSPRIKLLGVGVEGVEAEAARAFPHARLLRWDRDATRGRHAHEQILATFLAHDADILIGTQMLAKGLDLPAVTLVGVVNADVSLHLPDFRTGERTFQILTQVAGRAGRGERPGRVIIQTYTPDHCAIEAAARYDYEGFAAAELESRRRAGYPPYGRLVRLTLAHPNPRTAREEALRLQRVLSQRRAELGNDADVLGPSPSYVPRVRGRWRWQLLLRGRDPAALVRGFVLPQNWAVDVDPVSLL